MAGKAMIESERSPGADAGKGAGKGTGKARNLPLTIAKWIGIAVLGLSALIALILLGLNTGPGKRFIVDQVEALEFESGMKVGLGRIGGSIYGQMTLHDLAISDPEGVFLTVPQIEIDYSPFSALSSHVDVRSVIADRVTLARLPEFNETPPTDDPLLPDLDIDIDRLEIGRFIAEAPVSGERRVVTLAGETHISDGRAQVEMSGSTITGSDRAGGDRFALQLDAVPEENRLAIDLDLRAPGDGLIAALAGLTDPLTVRVSGEGDWNRWDGDLNSDLAGSALTRLDLTARDGVFTVRGPTRIARLLEGQARALLGPATTIDLTATPDERRVDLAGTISSDAFRLNANGIVDLGENAFDDFRASFVLLQPSVLTDNLTGSGLRAALTLDGAFTSALVDYAINANRIAVNDTGLQNLAAEGTIQVDAERMLIPIAASVGRVTGLDTVAGGTLANIRLDGDLVVELNSGPRILSDSMQLRSDRIDAELILLADLSSGQYSGVIDGRIDNYRVESAGIFDITSDIDLRAENETFALEGRVGVRSRTLTNESVRDFLGGNAVLGADIAFGSDGFARFSDLNLRAPLVQITGGSGSYSPDGEIALNTIAMTDQYGRLGVRVAGTVSNPDATIRADNPNLGIGLANLEANITGADGGYRLDATGDTDYGPLAADVVLKTGANLAVDVRSANLGEFAFDGALVQTAAGPFSGRLNATGNGFDGVVRLDAEGEYQEALINLRASDASLPGPFQLTVGSAIVDAKVVLYETPHVIADAQIGQARFGEAYISAARAKVDYRGGSGTARILAEGRSSVPFRVAANAQLEPDLWRAAIKGKARGVAFRTKGPARIVPGDGGYELLPTQIEFGQGSLRLAGEYGDDALKVQSRLDKIDLEIVNAFMPGLGINGSATGSLDFAQTGDAFPRADGRISITNFTRTTAVSISDPVDVNFVGKLLSKGADAHAIIRQRGSVIGRLNTSLTPLPPGAGAWTERLMAAPLSGGIRYNGPAATLFSLAGQPDQRLSGPIGIAADFSCRVSDPCLDGLIRAKNLTYENQVYGTRLTDMALEGTFSGSRLEITRLRASAGDGAISANGFVGLAADGGYPMNVSVTLDDARLAESDALSATANGELRLTKAAGQTALLAGEISLPETRYEVVQQGAAQVATLEGVRFKPPTGPVRITGDEPADTQPGAFALLRLDLALRAPEKLYISGMGLESEWSADFNITGTSAEPVLAGDVELVRGTLGFAGRSFALAEGRIGFTGGRTINPTINLVANDEIEDVTVNVSVAGQALDPQIGFSSSPGLPQDEIVSRILFGNSVGNLSAIQAVQLAASLNSLRSTGGGLNPLGKLRAATGVDRLRIVGPNDETGQGTSLAAGQYITDDVYVELVTDARGFTATQLEISLTPALSILSQAGGAGGTDVNLQYRKDY